MTRSLTYHLNIDGVAKGEITLHREVNQSTQKIAELAVKMVILWKSSLSIFKIDEIYPKIKQQMRRDFSYSCAYNHI